MSKAAPTAGAGLRDVVAALNPCDKYSATSITASEPTMATATGLFPSRIAGRTNQMRTRRLSPSATRARTPNQPARPTTATMKSVNRTLRGRRRWKSEPATIPDGLVRLSVGIEDVDDLWDDLTRALDTLA